jgi:hypothetical protein
MMQLGSLPPRVTTEKPGGATVGAQQPEQDADRGGLAGTVGTEESVDLTRGDGQVQPVEGGRGTEPAMSMTLLTSTDAITSSEFPENLEICVDGLRWRHG